MFIRFFHTHFLGWFSVLVYKTGLKRPFPLLYICGKYLCTQIIDRLPNYYRKSWLGPFRIFRISIDAVFKKRQAFVKLSDDPIAIYNGNLHAAQIRREYIQAMCGEVAGMAISKDALSSSSGFFWKVMSVTTIFFTSIFTTLLMPFTKYRANYAILPLLLVETSNLLQVVKQQKIKKIHHFCIYLSDGNLTTILLNRYGVKINKIPSEIPMGLLNKVIIGDSLSLCFRYQDDEMKVYGTGMHVKQIDHWVPETVFSNAAQYIHKPVSDPGKTLGYYSSALWLREELGHMDFEDHTTSAEVHLIQLLGKYLATRPDIRFQIFLHPLEKNTSERLTRARAWYKKMLGDTPYEIANETRRTADCFQESNIAISVISAILFERLFFGFKSLLFPEGMNEFPIKESNFNRICPANPADLITALDKNFPLQNDEFFKVNGIENYTWSHYPKFVEYVNQNLISTFPS